MLRLSALSSPPVALQFYFHLYTASQRKMAYTLHSLQSPSASLYLALPLPMSSPYPHSDRPSLSSFTQPGNHKTWPPRAPRAELAFPLRMRRWPMATAMRAVTIQTGLRPAPTRTDLEETFPPGGPGAGAPLLGRAVTGGKFLFHFAAHLYAINCFHSRNDTPQNQNPGNNLHVSGLSSKVDTRDLEAAFAKVGRVSFALS